MADHTGETPHVKASNNTFYWDDGTMLTPDELAQNADIINQIKESRPDLFGAKNPDGTFGGTSNNVQAASVGTAPLGTWVKTILGDLGGIFGTSAGQTKNTAPGAQLDTSLADAERERTGSLLASLQQQAATGDGAWQESFANATKAASNNAQALGQSTPGVGYASGLANIADAQGAVAQKAVGQEAELRAKAKQDAALKASGLLAGQGAGDVTQATQSAGVNQGRRQANAALDGQTTQNTLGTLGSIGQAFGVGASLATGKPPKLSDGGHVPGQPRTFGDDEKNDTVPAWLSPGEIVLPRSVAKAPNAPEAAARFVASLKASKPSTEVGHYDEGGQVPPPKVPVPVWKAGMADSSAGGITEGENANWVAGSRQAPSIENGGLLNTAQADQSRMANIANDVNFTNALAGRGPSVAPTQTQEATDNSIASALQAQAGRGAGNAAAAGYGVQEAAARGSAAAGKAGETAQGESNQATSALMRSLAGQRDRDQALALAQQQAAWRNTQLNMGIGLAQQAQLRNLLSGAGQGLSALASTGAFSGGDDGFDAGEPSRQKEIDAAFDSEDGFAMGGEVMAEDEKRRARDFVASLRGMNA